MITAEQQTRGRLEWTEEMNTAVLECKKKALILVKSDQAPVLESGKKKGYMRVMKELWDDMGYEHMKLSSQNLRDQAARLEKSMGDVVGNTSSRVGPRRRERNRENQAKSNENNNCQSSRNVNEVGQETLNLHTSLVLCTQDQTTIPLGPINILSHEEQELFEPSAQLMVSINTLPEDCSNREIDSAEYCGPQDEACSSPIRPNLPEISVPPSKIKDKNWGNLSYQSLYDNVTDIYNEIVHFRRNIFKIPSGKAGKSFIEELTFWLKQFNSSSDLNSIALKVFMVLPSLILQKPSATSKVKEHSAAIDRRLALWRSGDLNLLMKEVKFIQKKFVTSRKVRSIDDISKVFAKLIMQGKLSAALKFLDRESSSGLLTLTQEVLEELKAKHPQPSEVVDECLLQGPINIVPPSIFDVIDEQKIHQAAMKTKGSAGPSGMDAELYRRILCSRNFSTVGKKLREEIAILTRKLLTTSYHPSLLESYTASRLIPLDKNPGIRPIGVGEVLRRIIGKTVSWSLNDEIKEAAGPLQACAGHSAGAEAAVHGMSQVFAEEETDGILLIDASNAFNQMNRSVALHNIQITCPEMSQYIINTYRKSSRLFISGGGEILSQEGTTQGDPLAMPWYSINTSIMIQSLSLSIPDVKQVWLADDSAGGGRIKSLYLWYKHLGIEGKKYGYLVNGVKSWLIVKSQALAEEAQKVFGKEVNITVDGKRHLGAVVGSKDYKDQYCNEKVSAWRREIETLSEIATSQPHAAYVAFTKGYRSKFTYFMRTIESFEDYVDPIHEVLNDVFLPTIFGQNEQFPDELKELFTLPPAQGGLGMPNLKVESPQQYAASISITRSHVDSITMQSTMMKKSEPSIDDLKKHQQSLKATYLKSKMETIDASLPSDLLPLVNQARDKGASSWLNAIPLEEQGLQLNKQEFRDSLRIRYNLPLSGLPSYCACGEGFSINHALSCKKGGFVAQRHDGIRDLLTSVISKVCKNVETEPHLQPLDNERFNLRSANTSPEARLDIKAGGFWSRGVTAFFDVRVTHVNSTSNQNKPTSTIFREQENEKKRQYLQRVLEVEHGTFTPLVFGTNGGMGVESALFLKTLAEFLATKNGESYAIVVAWLRTRLSFEILRSVHLSVRGSRVPFKKRDEGEMLEDFRLNVDAAEIF